MIKPKDLFLLGIIGVKESQGLSVKILHVWITRLLNMGSWSRIGMIMKKNYERINLFGLMFWQK